MVLSASLLLESVLNFDRYEDEGGEAEVKWEGRITMTGPVLPTFHTS